MGWHVISTFHWKLRLQALFMAPFAFFVIWVASLVNPALSKWPEMTYVGFTIWTMALVIWSYRSLDRYVPGPADYDDKWSPLSFFYDSKFTALRDRYWLYFLTTASAWCFVFVGRPEAAEAGAWQQVTIMEVLAGRYLGNQTGVSTFEFDSNAHMIVYYAMCLLPLLILLVGGWLIHRLSKAKLRSVREVGR